MNLYFDPELTKQVKMSRLPAFNNLIGLTDRDYERLAKVGDDVDSGSTINQETDLKANTFKTPVIKNRNRKTDKENIPDPLVSLLFGQKSVGKTACPDCHTLIAPKHLPNHKLKNCGGGNIALKLRNKKYGCELCQRGFSDKLELIDHLFLDHTDYIRLNEHLYEHINTE